MRSAPGPTGACERSFTTGGVDASPPTVRLYAGRARGGSGAERRFEEALRFYERALAVFRKILELSPNNKGIQRQIGLVLSLEGRQQEALALLTQLHTPDPPAPQLEWLAYVYARAGQRDEALKWLRQLQARAAHEPIPPIRFVSVYLGLGDNEQALVWLSQAYAEQSDHLKTIGTDPIFDPLRADPRFMAILRGVGLTP